MSHLKHNYTLSKTMTQVILKTSKKNWQGLIMLLNKVQINRKRLDIRALQKKLKTFYEIKVKIVISMLIVAVSQLKLVKMLIHASKKYKLKKKKSWEL